MNFLLSRKDAKYAKKTFVLYSRKAAEDAKKSGNQRKVAKSGRGRGW